MELLMRTVDFPARERFDAWADLVAPAITPVEMGGNSVATES